MFEKIIVGFDGLDGGYDAIALAQTLCPESGRIDVLHSFHYDFGPLGAPSDESGTAIMEAVTGVVTKATDSDPRVTVKGISDMFAAPGLHRAAEQWDADLIVVGSCHLGAVGRLLLGDVSRGTLDDSPCPVAIAPRDYRKADHLLRKVGVGYNGTPESRDAFQTASQLATERGLKLRVMSSLAMTLPVSPFLNYSADWEEIQADHRAVIENDLQQLTRSTKDVGTDVVRMAAERALAELSEQVDLLFVGSRGWGRLQRVALGSATDRLIHHAVCPLIVVPRPALDRSEARKETMASA